MEMSSEGPKMWKGAMGWPEVSENGRKITKCPVTHGGCRRNFAGPIPARPAAVGREISLPASSGCPPPICLVHVQ